MNTGLDIAVLRTAVVMVPIVFAIGFWFAAAPNQRLRGAVLLSILWNFTSLLAVNAVAVERGWWHFGTDELDWSGVPVDVVLGWAVLWGAVPLLMHRWIHPFVTAAVLLVADALAMGGLGPLVTLAPTWWWGEAVCAAVCLLPSVMLGYATAHERFLRFRVLAQVTLFTAILGFLVPTATFAGTGSSWSTAIERVGGTADILLIQLAALIALVGLRAVRDFEQHGGTPFPWDPPSRLVTTGPYGFVANPMQISAVLLLVIGAAITEQPALALVAAAAAAFSAGIAAWNERTQLRSRFGDDWIAYRRNVRDWWPRLYPAALRSPAVLHTARTCAPCSEVNRWFSARNPVALTLDPAEGHPEELRRARYRNSCTGRTEEGTRAVGAALEHLSLPWALVGWTMRAPVIAWLVQLVVDAFGGGPRTLTRPADPTA